MITIINSNNNINNLVSNNAVAFENYVQQQVPQVITEEGDFLYGNNDVLYPEQQEQLCYLYYANNNNINNYIYNVDYQYYSEPCSPNKPLLYSMNDVANASDVFYYDANNNNNNSNHNEVLRILPTTTATMMNNRPSSTPLPTLPFNTNSNIHSNTNSNVNTVHVNDNIASSLVESLPVYQQQQLQHQHQQNFNVILKHRN